MANEKIKAIYLKDDGTFPNNNLPVLHYSGVIKVPSVLAATQVKRLFRKNGWYNSWKSGIFPYHHYHSITHEVLGILKGETSILLGGEQGQVVEVKKGDVLIIPAGVAHKNLGEEDAVVCIGAYPDGKQYDMNYGLEHERKTAEKNITEVPMPQKDPVFGEGKGLVRHWANIQGHSAEN